MSNYYLQDRNLSFKARWLLSFMLSLSDEGNYSFVGLISVSKENIKVIRTILSELKDNIYLVIVQTRGNRRYYKYNYIIYEHPITIEKDKNNPDTTVEGDAEKDIQINTNIQNTKEQKEKEIGKKILSSSDNKNIKQIDINNDAFIIK